MEVILKVTQKVVSMVRVSLSVTPPESEEKCVGFREVKRQDSSPVIPSMIDPHQSQVKIQLCGAFISEILMPI